MLIKQDRKYRIKNFYRLENFSILPNLTYLKICRMTNVLYLSHNNNLYVLIQLSAEAAMMAAENERARIKLEEKRLVLEEKRLNIDEHHVNILNNLQILLEKFLEQ